MTGFPTDGDKFARDLAAGITELLHEPEKAKALGKAGRKRAEDQFSWKAIAAQTIEMYEGLIKKR